MDVKATCKNCDKQSMASQFRLHYKYKMMVCPDCYAGKNDDKPIKKEAPKMPPGWDAEDDYLEKIAKIRKEENQAQFSKIPGTDQVKCKCSSCKYSFKYNPFKRIPRMCPYCNVNIPKLKTFNLL